MPHRALTLQQKRPIIFAALSKKNFCNAMLISKFVFDRDCVPINPFTNFGYYLYELVPRDKVRNGNNNLLVRSDELWVFGDISDGVQSEVTIAKKICKPIKYFDISQLPKKIIEIPEKEARIEN